MPTDSNGVFSLSAGYLATTGQTIQASQHNPPLEDISTALTARMPRNGAAPMTAALKVYDGTVGSPGVQFSSAGTTGIYKTSSGLGVSVGGVLVGEFTSSGLSATLAGAAPTVSGILTLTSTSHLVPATGTTAQRPASPAASNLRYNSTLNALEYHDGTSWRQVSAAQPIAAGFKNLVVQNNASTPNSKIDITADAITVETTAGVAYRLTSVSLIINAATTGANALDTGTLANSTNYYHWVIYNPSTETTAGLTSTSSTAPTMPSGYTAKARVGWGLTNGSAQFLRIIQRGKRGQFAPNGTNPANWPTPVSGSLAGVWTPVNLAGYAPPTANIVTVTLSAPSGTCAVAPNGGFSMTQLSSPSPTLFLTSASANITGDIVLETLGTIYANTNGTGQRVMIVGWEDNI